MANVCLVLLCGIPGCGKTTIAQQIQKYLESKYTNEPKFHTFVHMISYDEFIPVESNFDEYLKDSLWKLNRQQLLEMVEVCIQILIKFSSRNEKLPLSKVITPDRFMERMQTYLESFQEKREELRQYKNHVFMIDDNMYYRSMRYEYYQLARKYTTCFAEVYLSCPVEIALKRNRLRHCIIPDHIIYAMAKKIEPPDKNKNWEKMSITIDLSNSVNNILEELTAFLFEAQQMPVDPVKEDDTELIEKSRIICSTSHLHQADLILRKLITSEMDLLKCQGLSKKDLQTAGKELNKKKNVIYKSLQIGEILLPESYVTECANAAKQPTSLFYQFIYELFTGNLCQNINDSAKSK